MDRSFTWVIFVELTEAGEGATTDWAPGMHLPLLCILLISSALHNLGRSHWHHFTGFMSTSYRLLINQPLFQCLPLPLIKLPVTGTRLPFQPHFPLPHPLPTSCSSYKTPYQQTQTWEIFFFEDFIYPFMRDTQRSRDIGRGRSRFPAGSLTKDSIPELSQMQMLNQWATQAPKLGRFLFILFFFGNACTSLTLIFIWKMPPNLKIHLKCQLTWKVFLNSYLFLLGWVRLAF